MTDTLTIGILGGGQLGKMLSQAAKRMGFGTIVLDPTPECPAYGVADDQIVADFKDESAIRQLAERSDVITYEIELGNSRVLKELEELGTIVNPSPETLEVIQDKLKQKEFLRNNKIPVPNFSKVESLDDLMHALHDDFTFPAFLKATKDSYDGRGNYFLQSVKDVEPAFNKFKGRELMLEEYVPFDKEVSVIAARNTHGKVSSYPVGENIHTDSILDKTIVPARIDEKTQSQARKIAERTLKVLKGAGVFGIEMFAEHSGIRVNEIAPRVHNSGHYSIEASYTSQFEQHIRAILGLPLGDASLRSHVVMKNILGQPGFEGRYKIDGVTEALSIPGVYLHMYGKKEVRPKRKMGHLTVVDVEGKKDTDLLISRAETARSLLRLEPL